LAALFGAQPRHVDAAHSGSVACQVQGQRADNALASNLNYVGDVAKHITGDSLAAQPFDCASVPCDNNGFYGLSPCLCWPLGLIALSPSGCLVDY